MSFTRTLPQVPAGPLVAVIGLTDSGGAAEVTSIVQIGATWQPAIQGGDGNNRSEVWWSGDAAGASQLITINTVADQNETGIVAEYAGIIEQSGTALDQVASAAGNSATADSGSTPTTTDPDEIWVSGLAVRGGSAVSAPTSGFIIDASDATGAGGTDVSETLLSLVVAAVGIAQVQATIDGGAADFGGAIATFFVQPPDAGPLKEGWGKDEWGTSPWGSAVPQASLAIQNARALSTKEIEVTLNRDPQAIAATVDGDSLNPDTWVLQRLDTGFFFSVITVRQTGPATVVLTVLQDLGSVLVDHRVLTTTLLDSNGNAISNTPLNQFDFKGVLDAEFKDAITRAQRAADVVRDIANPPLPARDPIASIGGTLLINSFGDYELESGEALLRKLIIRRLVTQSGAFFHLPEYGIGLGVKELLPASNLILLRTEIIREIQREPEVVAADATLLLGNQNDLTVQIRAKLATSGDTVVFGFRLTPDGLTL